MPAPKFPDNLIKAGFIQIPLPQSHQAHRLFFPSASPGQIVIFSKLHFQGVREVKGDEFRFDRYDLKSGENLSRSFMKPMGNPDFAVSPDGTHLAAVDSPFTSKVALRSLTKNQEIVAGLDLENPSSNRPGGRNGLARIALLSNDRLLAVHDDGARALWNLPERRTIYRIAPPGGQELKTEMIDRQARNHAISPDGKWLALHRGSGFDLIATESGAAVKHLADSDAAGGFAEVWATAFRGDGRELIACYDARLELGNFAKRETRFQRWDVETGTVRSKVKIPSKVSMQYSLCYWGDNYALFGNPVHTEGMLMDLKKGQYVRHLKVHGPPYGCAETGPDGRLWFVANHESNTPPYYLTGLEIPADSDFQVASPVQSGTALSQWFLTPDGIEKQPRP